MKVDSKAAQDRAEILEVIRRLERDGRFDVDAEDDPPTIPLLPDGIDYLRTKPADRIRAKAAYFLAEQFVHILLRKKKLVIKNVYGMEHLNGVSTGGVITCNHFNPYDCLTVEYLFRQSEHFGKRQLYKVIREGNYTNFPGFYGCLFRNCNTLPLSRNKETMRNFLKAVEIILARGDFILIYPEQSMWWNYRKPRPLKNGAFKFAAQNNVPVIPFFIAMEDGDRTGEDGFPVQEYTVFIEKPIYPQTVGPQTLQDQAEHPYMRLPGRGCAVKMRDENFRVWKKIYEDFYGAALVYECEKNL